jgi:hypothetical protein
MYLAASNIIENNVDLHYTVIMDMRSTFGGDDHMCFGYRTVIVQNILKLELIYSVVIILTSV